MRTGVWWRNLRERGHLEDTGTDGSVTLSDFYINRLGGRGVDWIKLAQDKDKWLSVVNMEMNL